MALRETLAAVLGVGLGLFLVAFPDAVIRLQMVGRVPGNHHGEYGEDGAYPRSWRLLVRAIGVVVVLAGLYFASQTLGVL
jgi:hypothetical protein